MGAIQGFPQFPLCVHPVEQLIQEVLKQCDRNKPFGNLTVSFLISEDDVVLLAHSSLRLQKLLDTIHTFSEDTDQQYSRDQRHDDNQFQSETQEPVCLP